MTITVVLLTYVMGWEDPPLEVFLLTGAVDAYIMW